MCWMLMHPDSSHAIPPPSDDSVNVHKPGDGENLHSVPALMSDVEHAFVRSEDGKFIAVDRYRIQTDKKRTVIGVLGDGLVPLTFEKDVGGKETINTNVTCSYGNEHDSPATVVLMRGHESYSEHYFNKGKKYKSPFSTNGDRFRTMLILCEKLHFNVKLSRHPPLILRSPDGEFSLTIGSPFAKPFGKKYIFSATTTRVILKKATR